MAEPIRQDFGCPNLCRNHQKEIDMRNLNIIRIITSLGLLSAFLIMGCGGGKTPSVADNSVNAAKPSAAALAALAKADAADGKVDKVVSKCLTCMLGMEGKPENATAYGEFTLHFCSKTCKEAFLSDPEKVALALKFPEK
jgi:YHS domain-containing protein